MKCLIVDNYDSFTFNVVYLIKTIGHSVEIIKNNDNIDRIKQINPDRIIISPGPGSPQNSGICKRVIAEYGHVVPMLGICLGHQIIAEFFGGKVSRLSKIVHGKTSMITHSGEGLFLDVPNPTKVARYHSLHVEELPRCLEVTSVSEDGVVMAIRHRRHRLFGIQFHPESFMTENGSKIVTNFFDS